MGFITRHPKLVSIVSIALIGMSILANLLYFIFIPIQIQGDPKGYVVTPLSTQQPAVDIVEPAVASPTSMVLLVILLAMVLLAVVILFAGMKYFESKRKQRDQQRKQDLKTLAQAFEAYKQIHGQYPLSSTFRPEYYTGVNLSNDWNYYGLPGSEHMTHFVPNWPISDPSIDYMSRNQVNQYLYYPKENGQKFFLYAHLEAPTKEENIDYNLQDNLLRSWGFYNYRVASGQEQPLQVSDEHKTPHPAPLPPQGTSAPSSPLPQSSPNLVNQPVSTDTANPATGSSSNSANEAAPATTTQPAPNSGNQTIASEPNISLTEEPQTTNQAQLPGQAHTAENTATSTPTEPTIQQPTLQTSTSGSAQPPLGAGSETSSPSTPSSTPTQTPAAPQTTQQPPVQNSVPAATPAPVEPTATSTPDLTTEDASPIQSLPPATLEEDQGTKSEPIVPLAGPTNTQQGVSNPPVEDDDSTDQPRLITPDIK